MNAPDQLSFCTFSFALEYISFTYKRAHEEIGAYRDIVKSASDLFAEFKNKPQELEEKSYATTVNENRLPPYTPQSIYITFMGQTGTGKTTCKTTGGGLGVEHGLNSCTWGIEAIKTAIDDRIVTFIDTPGLHPFKQLCSEENHGNIALTKNRFARKVFDDRTVVSNAIAELGPWNECEVAVDNQALGSTIAPWEDIYQSALNAWIWLDESNGKGKSDVHMDFIPKNAIWLNKSDGEGKSDVPMDFIPQIMDFPSFDQGVRAEGQAYKWAALTELMKDRWLSRLAQFGTLPRLSSLPRWMRSLGLKGSFVLSAICFSNPILADDPGSGNGDYNWLNISPLIKHTDSLSSYRIKFPFPDFMQSPSSTTFGTGFLIYCSAALVFHRLHKDDQYQNHFLVSGLFCGMLMTIASTNGAGASGPFLAYVPGCVTVALAISAVLHRAIAKRQAQSNENPGNRLVDVTHSDGKEVGEKISG